MFIQSLDTIFKWIRWIFRHKSFLLIIFLLISVMHQLDKTGYFPFIPVIIAFILGWRSALKISLKGKDESAVKSKSDSIININTSNIVENILFDKD